MYITTRRKVYSCLLSGKIKNRWTIPDGFGALLKIVLLPLLDIEESYVYAIQEKLNNRARKALNHFTPNEALALELKKGL